MSYKKHTIEFVRKVFEEKGCKLVSTEYINTESKLEYLCNCGSENIHLITFTNFRLGQRCKDCKSKRAIETKKALKLIKENTSSDNVISHVYNNKNIIPADCAGDVIPLEDNIYKSDIIPAGGAGDTPEIVDKKNIKILPSLKGLFDQIEKQRLKYDDVKKLFEEKDCVLISTEYKNSKTKLYYKCSCGSDKIHQITLQSFKLGIRCKDCRIERLKKTSKERFGYEYASQRPENRINALKTIMKLVESKRWKFEDVKAYYEKEGCVLLEFSYKSMIVKMKFKCKCGNEGFSTFSSFIRGNRCNSCKEDRKKQTNLKKFGSISYTGTEEYKERYKKTCLEKYGVEHTMQSVEIHEKAEKAGKKYKKFTMPSGEIRNVQGYEHFLLKELLKTFKEDDIITKRHDIPAIFFNDEKGKKHRYFPDMFVKSTNTIYEVKSTWTYKKGIEKIKLQEKACIEQGFNYKLFVYKGKSGKIDFEKSKI